MNWERAAPAAWLSKPVALQLQAVGADGVPGPPQDVIGAGIGLNPVVGVDRAGTAVVVFNRGRDVGAVSIHEDQAPCPAERPARHEAFQASVALGTADIGAVVWPAWQENASNVHLALYRPRPGWCPEPIGPDPPPAPPEPAPAPDGGPSRDARGRAPRVAAIARLAGKPRRVILRLACTSASAAPCAGKLELLPGKPPRSATSRGSRRIGAARFAIRAGRVRRVPVRLSRVSRRALRRGSKVRVRLEVPGLAPRYRRVTLR